MTSLKVQIKIYLCKRYKNLRKSCIILVKSWMLTPFETHTCFPIENDMVNFHRSKISLTDTKLTGDNQELSKMFDI